MAVAIDGISIPVRPGTPKAKRRRPEVIELEDIVDCGCENNLTEDMLERIDVILHDLDYPDVDDFLISHMYSLHPNILYRCLHCIRSPARVIHAAMFKGRPDLAQLLEREAFKLTPKIYVNNDHLVDIVLTCHDCSHFWDVFKLFGGHLTRADDVVSCLLTRAQDNPRDLDACLRLVGHRFRTAEAIEMIIEARPDLYVRIMKSVWLLPQGDLDRLNRFCDRIGHDDLKRVVNAELSNRKATLSLLGYK